MILCSQYDQSTEQSRCTEPRDDASVSLWTSWRWVGDCRISRTVNGLALDDPDLEPMWAAIGEI